MVERTIYLTGGINMATSRLLMKNTLDAYGPVELCNMGLQAKLNDPNQAPPVIRFATRDAAQRALEAMEAGLVIVVGLPVKGAWKSDVDRANGGPKKREKNLTSRELMKQEYESKRNSQIRRPRSRSGRGRGREDSRGRGPAPGRRGRSDSRDGRGPARRDPSRERPRLIYEPLAIKEGTDLIMRDESTAEQFLGGSAKREDGPRPPPEPAAKGDAAACALGHSLTEFIINDKELEYTCDICVKDFRKQGLVMNACHPCDWFVCQECSDNHFGVLG